MRKRIYFRPSVFGLSKIATSIICRNPQYSCSYIDGTDTNSMYINARAFRVRNNMLCIRWQMYKPSPVFDLMTFTHTMKNTPFQAEPGSFLPSF